jgi:hypothetical protein
MRIAPRKTGGKSAKMALEVSNFDSFRMAISSDGRSGQATRFLDAPEAKQFGEKADDPILFER